MKMVIIPSRYSSTPDEVIHLASQLAMHHHLVNAPVKSANRIQFLGLGKPPVNYEKRVIIHPHGHTPDERLHNLMSFFHCLGLTHHIHPMT